MSYAPSTKISHTNGTRRATVLTDGNVMVTGGLGYGQVMKIDDWIILADGAKIEEDYIPLPPGPASVPVPAQKSYPNGSKFRWTLNTETYRIAIQTDKGVLQVKSVTDGGGETHDSSCTCRPCANYNMVPRPPWQQARPLKKTMFADFAAWEASLPKSGHIIGETPEKKDDISGLAKLQDHEKINAIISRYKLRSWDIVATSANEGYQTAMSNVKTFREKLNTITLDQSTNSQQLKETMSRLNCSIKHYNRARRILQTSLNPNEKKLYFKNRGTGCLIARINNVLYKVFIKNNMIALTEDTFRSWGEAKLYPDFAAIQKKFYCNSDQNGKPTFYVNFYGRKIDLTL